jgi:hypothetical protein
MEVGGDVHPVGLRAAIGDPRVHVGTLFLKKDQATFVFKPVEPRHMRFF